VQRCLRDSVFSGFDTIPALVTDRRTDEHTTTAYTALAQRRAVKIRRIQEQKQNEAVRRMQGATMKLASDSKAATIDYFSSRLVVNYFVD